MHILMQASLEEAIQAWANKNCESGTWPQDILIGEDTVFLMAQAAGAVFEAVVESQRFARHERLTLQADGWHHGCKIFVPDGIRRVATVNGKKQDNDMED